MVIISLELVLRSINSFHRLWICLDGVLGVCIFVPSWNISSTFFCSLFLYIEVHCVPSTKKVLYLFYFWLCGAAYTECVHALLLLFVCHFITSTSAWMKLLSATKNFPYIHLMPKVSYSLLILMKFSLIFCLLCCVSPTVIYACLSFIYFAGADCCTLFWCHASVALAIPSSVPYLDGCICHTFNTFVGLGTSQTLLSAMLAAVSLCPALWNFCSCLSNSTTSRVQWGQVHLNINKCTKSRRVLAGV